MNNGIGIFIPDDEFIRGNVPMTKMEIRALTLSKLRLKRDSIVLDIGAGTGSLSIECGRMAKDGRVIAVEKNEEAAGLIELNIEKFRVQNISLIRGEAPEALRSIDKFNRAFVGGSGGMLSEILDWLDMRISAGGIVVMNAVTVNTLVDGYGFLKSRGYKTDLVLASISRCENIGENMMFKALNPVYIITGTKE